jgi:hypothetical protein
MVSVRILLVLAATLAVAGPVRADGPAPAAVVEMFTSQGCSSCPPADSLVADFARDPSVLALSFPVDYWDYLGWKDTFADKAFTARQRGYGEARGDRHVYTPQAIVDGLLHTVGSNRESIVGLRADGRTRGALVVPVTTTVDGSTIRVAVGAAAQPRLKPATVLLLPIMKRSEVAIARGENKGRTVTYTNVVRELIPLGVWDGSPRSFEAPAALASMRNADTFAVIVQEGTTDRPGLVIGAAKGPGL